MGKDTKIQWADHTFNIVWGCAKVSAGCKHCYAETLSNRYFDGLWGADARRRVMGEHYWRQPLAWNENAKQRGQRVRVFCGSMCDVFEDHDTTSEQRERLWPLIRQTPWIDWLLLTKRPDNIEYIMLSEVAHEFPRNVWLGTSIENQSCADLRVPHLISVPATVHFLSIEPQLSLIVLDDPQYDNLRDIEWVIVGGESGKGARPFHVDWAREIVRACADRNVACFVKQLGGNPVIRHGSTHSYLRLRDRKGGDPSEWPSGLNVRQFPKTEV